MSKRQTATSGGKIAAFLAECEKLVDRWRTEERERWPIPLQRKLTEEEIKELFKADLQHHHRIEDLVHHYFDNLEDIESPADLWAYIILVAVLVVETAPGAAEDEINRVLDGFAQVGLPTPEEPTWKTPEEAVRVLRRLADRLKAADQPPSGEQRPGEVLMSELLWPVHIKNDREKRKFLDDHRDEIPNRSYGRRRLVDAAAFARFWAKAKDGNFESLDSADVPPVVPESVSPGQYLEAVAQRMQEVSETKPKKGPRKT
jgi:hypothetical protein